MYAEFFPNEARARARLDAWAASLRADWNVGPVVELHRSPETLADFGPWGPGCVAPAHRAGVSGPLRILRRVAQGPWARPNEDFRGLGHAACDAAFPVTGEGQS